MKELTKPAAKPPKFKSEDEEADWWASAKGRQFLKQQSAANSGRKLKGSRFVLDLNRVSSVQIALRLPAPDIAQAREIAERKGIGYQTLLKMLVHEGLRREARRP
jgi:predicted DNA binding CopG/RHH family protein